MRKDHGFHSIWDIVVHPIGIYVSLSALLRIKGVVSEYPEIDLFSPSDTPY